jgi:hypothetical protein
MKYAVIAELGNERVPGRAVVVGPGQDFKIKLETHLNIPS